MRRLRVGFIFLVLSTLVGCANPPIVRVGDDLYLLSKQDHGGIFGSLPKLKADVIAEANNFAASKGMTAVPVSFREKPVGMKPADWASVEYQFRLVPPSSAEARGVRLNADRQTLPVRPDVSIQTNSSASAVVDVRHAPGTAPAASHKDLYTELLKLEDLRKRRLLTAAEFEAQKKKLLSGSN